jgi:hypothetical protein
MRGNRVGIPTKRCKVNFEPAAFERRDWAQTLQSSRERFGATANRHHAAFIAISAGLRRVDPPCTGTSTSCLSDGSSVTVHSIDERHPHRGQDEGHMDNDVPHQLVVIDLRRIHERLEQVN